MVGVLLAIAFAIGGYFAFAPAFGAGSYEALPKWFGGGLSAGSTEQFSVSNAGVLTQTAASSLATTSAGVFTQGGGSLASTTVSASFGTLTEAQLLYNNVIKLTPNILSATSTLPATSTLTTLLPNSGDTRTWLLQNGTSTASRWVGIAAGTGIDIQSNTLNNVQIAPNGTAEMRCTRISTTDVICRVDVHVAGD